MKNKLIINMVILMLTITSILGIIGFSYAYFNTDVNGEGRYITLDTAELRLKYTDDVIMSLNNAIPGDKIERTFTVENMNSMFYGNKSSVLDLSSFKLKDDVDLTSMFGVSKARIGYAKDEETAAKFNDSSITNIPSTLKFVVK